MHYKRWKNHGEPEVTRRGPKATCSVEGCEDPHSSKGMCSIHYQRWKRHGNPHTIFQSYENRGKPCKVDGCEKVHKGRGFCKNHYNQWYKWGDPLATGTGRVRGKCSVEGCDKPHSGRGYCATHYSRWSIHGDPQTVIKSMPPRDQSPWERASFQLVKRESGCIEWTGRTSRGYGVVTHEGKTWRAHRYVYWTRVGSFPEGFHVHHKCYNKLCCNVEHLQVMDPSEHCRLHAKKPYKPPQSSEVAS